MRYKDNVVCINNENYNLTVGRVYEVKEFFNISNGYFHIVNDCGNLCAYAVKHFITLKEYRKLKLDKINES